MKVFCVNLKKRKDRKIWVQKQFEKQGLEVEFVEGVENEESPKRGNALSHLGILESMKDKGESFMVFEDDVKFLIDDFLVYFEKIKTQLYDIDWSMFYFGATLGKEATNTIERIKPNILKIDSCFTTHAYMINHNYIDQFIETYIKGWVSADTSYRSSHKALGKVYLAYPLLCTQKTDYSDIERQQVNYYISIEQEYKIRIVDAKI